MSIEGIRTAGWPIARLLSVLLVGLVFLGMMPIIGVAYYAARSNYEASARERNEVMVDLVTRRLNAHLDMIKSQLTYVGEAISRGEIDFDNREQWSAFAVGTLAAVPQAVAFVVLPVDGQPSTFARTDRRMLPERRENIPGADQLLERARTMEGPGWGKPMWTEVLGETILPIIVPIRVHGEFRGLVGAAIRATDLSRFLVDLQLPDERTPFILFDHDKILAHPFLAQPEGIALQRARGRPSTLAEVDDPVLASIWAPDQRQIDWTNDRTPFMAHWNWVNDNSFAWFYRQVASTRPPI